MRRLIEIAQPCGSSWGEMSGAGAQRHCGLCNKTVHSLSDLDPVAAAQLLARSSAARQSICVRVRCDSDGYVRFAGGAARLSGPSKLRLGLTPVVLSAGLMAACNASNDDGRPPVATTGSSSAQAPAAQPSSAQRGAVDNRGLAGSGAASPAPGLAAAEAPATAITAAGSTRFGKDIAGAIHRAVQELSKPAAKMHSPAPEKRKPVPADGELEFLGDVR